LTNFQTPFSLEHDTNFNLPVLPAPKTTRAHRSADAIFLETNLKLDYWEVDPNWDGITFMSVAQARRPVRNGDIPCELKMKVGSNVCIRLVTADGKLYQLNI